MPFTLPRDKIKDMVEIVRASTKVERFFSQSGTIAAAHGTAYGPRILAKRNGSRANLERSSLKPGRSRDSLSMER